MHSGSLDLEITHRLGILYQKHNDWLNAVSYNLTKNKPVAEDLVQELYLYLGEKKNPKLFFNDSFNLKYCHNFLSSRWINLVKRENKKIYPQSWRDSEDVPYDVESDEHVDKTFELIKKELEELQRTGMWSSARIYELYTFSDMTMEELSDEIGISKSTTFLNVKKVKEHLRDKFKDKYNDKD